MGNILFPNGSPQWEPIPFYGGLVDLSMGGSIVVQCSPLQGA